MTNFKFQKGFGLLDFIIASAVMFVFFMAMIHSALFLRHKQQNVALQIKALELRSNLVTLMKDASAWDKTLNAPENIGGTAQFDCMINNTCNLGGAFVIKDGIGNIFFRAGTAQGGFSKNLSNCNYTGLGDDNCPFSLQLSWNEVAPHLVLLRFELLFSPKTNFILNTSKWKFNLYKYRP